MKDKLRHKRVVKEYKILSDVGKDAFKHFDNGEKDVYCRYSDDLYNVCSWYTGQFSKILDVPQLNSKGEYATLQDCIDYIEQLEITNEHIKQLKDVRKEPWFRKIMGENSLKNKAKLEEGLGLKYEINNEGETFIEEDGETHVACKTEEQVAKEFDEYFAKLSDLHASGKLSDEQYDDYWLDLNYIQAYYGSMARGEQICLEKMTNAQYEKLEKEAEDELGCPYTQEEFDEYKRSRIEKERDIFTIYQREQEKLANKDNTAGVSL